ncbi:hypothetical protein [Burkholderia gladioli]|uniref:hypothetical protein n=1 Tax=Burkholderia gladioli TaxID=28095 RepID=UPI0016410A18|nr:hypothetical protein [Burkholderia gladioli]
MNRRPRRSIDAINAIDVNDAADAIDTPRSIGRACRIGRSVACRRGGAPEPRPPARRPPSRAMP